MSKLKLIAKAILADVKNPDIPEEKKIDTMEEGMKAFAVECTNMLKSLTDGGVNPDMAAMVMGSLGLDYDGRTKKFK